MTEYCDTISDHAVGHRYDWIAHHARLTPAKRAIIDVAGGRSHTYAQLNTSVDHWARWLAERGAERGDRIAVLAQNSPAVLELQFACARSGLVFVPLNWRLTGPELGYIVNDAAPSILLYDITNTALAQSLSPDAALPQYSLETATTESDLLPAVSSAALVPLTDVACLMYTSGTTGRPKGAIITHQMTLWHAVNITPRAHIDSRSVQLVLLPFFHTGGLNLYVNPILHAGGTVVLPTRFDAEQTFDLLEDADIAISHMFAVPTVYQELLGHRRFAGADLGRLRMAGVGGAACPLSVLHRWRDKGVPLSQGWGMTEGGPSGTVVDVNDPTTPPDSVGKPLLHIGFRIVDTDGSDVPVGATGEIWIQGPSVTPGYWNNPAATADSTHDGWFKTGDAARADEFGNIFIVDRWKDMYISGGENVYPLEVETVILQLESVSEVAVVGAPHPKWGEVGEAYVVTTPGRSVTAAEVADHCRVQLARFKVPARVHFVDSLPRTASGKVQKRKLAGEATSAPV